MPDNNKYNINMTTDLNCIWMVSKYIDYQYCDKGYNCESCSLDIVLRNLTQNNLKENNKYFFTDTNFIDNIINDITREDFQNNLIYLKNNFVLKHLYANIFYMGINPVALPILDSITGVKEYMKRVYFIQEQKLLTIEGEWGELSLKVPLNFLLLDKLNWTPEDIRTKKWIALVVVNQEEIDDSKISAEQWKDDKLKLLNILNEYRECCHKIINDFSGSEIKLNNFYQLVGKTEYIKLLNQIFSV